MRILRFFIVAALAGCCWTIAAGQAETLNNIQVIEMVRAGLSDDVVLRKIGSSDPKFDITAAALIELKKNQISDALISAMIDRQESTGSGQAARTGFSESGTDSNQAGVVTDKIEIIRSARTIALVKSSAHPSRQGLEKELLKRPDFRATGLTIVRYKDKADLYVEIGYVSLSWLTHRYVYRIFDRRTGVVLAAGETTSWGSLAGNLARKIATSLKAAA